MRRFATLSECGRYRYTLTRDWRDVEGLDTSGTRLRALFVMLNPSTADASVDDPTIRRCVGFARREGCTALDVVNLYAFRATDPRQLDQMRKAGVDIVGKPANDAAICELLEAADLVVAAWGGHKLASGHRAVEVRRLMRGAARGVECLGRTAAGAPRHPLYLSLDAELEPFPLSTEIAR